jgi:hypothetical protein
MSQSYSPSPSEFSVLVPRRRSARAPAQPLAPRKPLLLDGRVRPIGVRVAGPALAIERGERTLTVPLTRIARVIVRGRVHWDSAALVLCLQQRVPIVLLDGHARPAGAALPLVAHTGALDELLCAFVERGDWQPRYENWLRSERLRVLLRWGRERARSGRPVDPGEWAEQVRSFVYLGESAFAGTRAGAAYALVLGVLLRAGVRTQYRAAAGGTLALARDLALMLERRLALECGTLARGLERLEPLAARACAASADEQEGIVVEQLQRLRRCVADLVEPWP